MRTPSEITQDLSGGENYSMSEAIAVTSGKGGTGKSTVCAGIGNALAQAGYSTVIMEIDFGFRCLDVFFGMTDRIQYDISDYIRGKCRLRECVYKVPDSKGLSIICAPFEFSRGFDSEKIGETIRKLKILYDFVLIDTGAGAAKEVLEALKNADRIFFAAIPDAVSIRDAANLSEEFHRIGCGNQRLIINRVHRKYIDHKMVDNLDAVIDACGIQLIGVVPEDLSLMLFYGRGKKLSPGTAGHAAFAAIAERICGNNVPLSIVRL